MCLSQMKSVYLLQNILKLNVSHSVNLCRYLLTQNPGNNISYYTIIGTPPRFINNSFIDMYLKNK